MRFTPGIFSRLLEPIDRRSFRGIVEAHDGDAYDKSFTNWDHLTSLVFAQFSAADTLRGLQASWNAHSQHHYHLGTGPLSHSTLSDANKRRPVAIFAKTFAAVAGLLDRPARRDSKALIRLIDSTPIPLGKLCEWATFNGRIRGMKVHVLYDPKTDCPRILDITDATINDAQIGRTVRIEPGATYVFDKGYCHYGWWTAIAAAGSVFVTRPKANMGLAIEAERAVSDTEGDGFTILADAVVRLASKGDSKLPVRLRRLVVRRHDDEGGPRDTITLITNDLDRSAVDIAALYKGRWRTTGVCEPAVGALGAVASRSTARRKSLNRHRSGGTGGGPHGGGSAVPRHFSGGADHF